MLTAISASFSVQAAGGSCGDFLSHELRRIETDLSVILCQELCRIETDLSVILYEARYPYGSAGLDGVECRRGVAEADELLEVPHMFANVYDFEIRVAREPFLDFGTIRAGGSYIYLGHGFEYL